MNVDGGLELICLRENVPYVTYMKSVMNFTLFLNVRFFSEERKRFVDRQYFSNPNILKFKELMNSKDETKLKNLSIFANILINTFQ